MLFDDGTMGLFDVFPWKLFLVFLAFCIARAYFKGASYKERGSAKNLVAVITGGNVGIGKQIIRELNLRGAKVYMLCRDKGRGLDGKSELVKLGCNPTRLEMRTVDLCSFDSIRKFASDFASEEQKLDLLICNAGVMLYPKFKLTEDGHETTWQTNYLAHFYSDPIDLESIDRRERWDSRQSYAKSKLAQVMYTRALARHLNRQNCETITVNACHPGLCYTRIVRHTPVGNNKVLKFLLAPFIWFFTKTPKDGAQTPLFLCLSSKVAAISGKYFTELSEKPTLALAMDDAACERLYAYSRHVCALDDAHDNGGSASEKEQ